MKLAKWRSTATQTALVVALAMAVVAVFLVDRGTPPEVPLAVLYALPLFIAGVWLPRWLAAALGAFTLALYVLDGYITGSAWTVFRIVGLGAVALALAWALYTGYTQARLSRTTLELAEKAAALEAAKADRDVMTSVIAHELRGALSPIAGYSKLLLRPNSSIEPRTALQAIARGSDQLDRLTQDLLDTGNLDLGRFSLQRQSFDIVSLVAANVELYRQLTNRTMELRLPAEPIFGSWDELRLSQVVRNLLSNAVKYSAEDATVDIAVEGRPSQALVSIANQTEDLSPEKLDRLFSPYSRLGRDERVAGSGLGLYVTKAIIEHHGGRIGATFEGRRFCIEFALPVTAA